MLIKILNYSLFFAGLFVANGLQRFQQQPDYTEVNPGDDVKLTCTVLNKRGTCSWQKNNKVSYLL